MKRGVLAVGEIGLGYPGFAPVKPETKRMQQKVLRQCLQLAVDLNLPVISHIRNAEEDAFVIVTRFLPECHRIHLHCFNYPFHVAEKWMNHFSNLYIGITPLITYPTRNRDVEDLGERVPLRRLLIESDAPYFVPQSIKDARRVSQYGSGPRQRMLSHPAHAFYVAVAIAQLRQGVTVEDVCKITGENMIKLFRCRNLALK